MPAGLYTVNSTPKYYAIIDSWFYDGNIDVYEDRILKNTVKVQKDENIQIELHEGQTVIFRAIEISHRDELPSSAE